MKIFAKSTNFFIVIIAITLLFFGFSKTIIAIVNSQINPLPEELQLKAGKDDVLASKVITIFNVDEQGRPIKETARPATFYAYKSDVQIMDMEKEIVVKRTMNSRTFKTSEQGVYIAEFISGNPQYYKDDNDNWWQIEYATTSVDVFERQLGYKKADIAYATSVDFFPDGNAVDGVIISNDSSSWSGARDASAGDWVFDSDTQGYFADSINEPGNYRTSRSFLLFDTSSIGSSSTINSATLSVYITNKDDYDNDEYDYINIFTTTPASNDDLVIGDFDQVGNTKQASDIDITDISTGAYTDFSLNSTGISNISKTGITKFGGREGHDVDNQQPAYSAAGNTTGVGINFSETSGTSQDPKLVVVYSDTTPPVVSGLTAGDITENSAAISWTTDDYSDSEVVYGTTTPVANSNPLCSSSSPSFVTSHNISLNNLDQGTTYYYIASSTNSDGYSGASSEQSFTSSSTVPAISDIEAESITSGAASIVWTTDLSSNSKVWYNASSPVSDANHTEASNGSLVTSHNVGLSSLADDTLYYYIVVSSTASGGTATSSEQTFLSSGIFSICGQ